ncbi:MAG: Endoglucanase [Actinomycetota bacterium]|nr:Endoglucanase [Actinomycetota bacterium]
MMRVRWPGRHCESRTPLSAVVGTAAALLLVPLTAPAAGATSLAGSPAGEAAGSAAGSVAAVPAATGHDYAEALQKSIFFYEAQQSGKLPDWNRVEWRGDATTKDGGSAGVDLSGGWYDAGDHVKFGFPLAFTTTMLAWGVVENPQAYTKAGQLTAMLDNLRWATDYLVAAHPSPDTLYVQVGDGGIDHAYWGPPEMIDILGHSRPVYKITRSCPGTDVAAETAAALAAASLAFRSQDPAYSRTLVTHAEQLMTFAESTKGTDGRDTAYVSCVTAAQGYYNSINEGGWGNPGATKMYWDELAWGSAWLHRATGEASYLQKARTYYPKMGSEDDPAGSQSKVPVYSFGLGWNDKQYGVYVLMASLTGEQQFETDAQRWLDYWTVGYHGKKGTITPGGMAYIFYWGSLRMAAHTAWAALVYADHLGSSNALYSRYHDFAKRQIDYALGDNPGKHSYVVGYGTNPPTHVHHRAASGQNLGYMSDLTGPNRHVIYGALAGGPDQNDKWVDDRGDYQRNEVAVDYNAGFTAAAARLAGEYGGTPVPDSQLVDPVRDTEMSVDVITDHSGPDGASLRVTITNASGWAPRVLDEGVVRYWFTLDGSTTADQIKVTSSGSGGCAVRQPKQHSGSTYYFDLDCTGVAVHPGSNTTYQRTTPVGIQVTRPGTWDSSNDWSAGKNAHVALYDAGTIVWGEAPATTAGTTTRSAAR